MNFFKHFFQKNLLNILPIEVIESLINGKKIQNCKRQVTLGEDSKFYEQAKVSNLINDKTKIVIGNNSHIRGELVVYPYGGRIEMGDYCYIGEGTRVWSGEQIKMGNNVLIAHNVNIMDFAHERDSFDRAQGFKNLINTGHPKEKGKIPTARIIIEDDVAIYAGVNIMMGVTIGKGSVIAAGSFITKDVPPFSLMTGNPARRVWKLK